MINVVVVILLLTEGLFFFKVLPVGRMLLELHNGVYSSGRYMLFVNSVQPLLLDRVWSSKDKNKFWVGYRIAQSATKRVSPKSYGSLFFYYNNFIIIIHQGFHDLSGKIYGALHQKV